MGNTVILKRPARNGDIATLRAMQKVQAMLPIRRAVAELVAHDDRAIARVAIERLLKSKEVGERICRMTGKSVLVDRRPSRRESGFILEMKRAA